MRILFATLLIGTLTVSIIVGSGNVSNKEGTYTIHSINESTLEINFNNAEVLINNSRETLLIDKITGKTTVLPSESIDKNGNKVDLIYKRVNDSIHIQLLDERISKSKEDYAQVRSFSIWKCILGTGGAAVTGAGTLGLAGSAVGTVTIPGIGTVAAGAVGAITGAVGGGMTGSAASCF